MLRAAWDAGERVEKLIGFDATEDHRAKGNGGTFVANPKMNLSPMEGVPHYKDRYNIRYPLREQGIRRLDCRDIIVAAGLPVPCKSACFSCPAAKQYEVTRLAAVDPAYYCLSIAMEVLYRTGKHFRGDDFFTLKAKHKETGEVLSYECHAKSKEDARNKFRRDLKDTARPFAYTMTVNQAVGGLDFGTPWLTIPAHLPLEYRDRLRDFLARRGHAFTINDRVLPVLA